ncbi:hypothetical protein AB0G05_02665 [Nonomuraea wenchangensis]
MRRSLVLLPRVVPAGLAVAAIGLLWMTGSWTRPCLVAGTGGSVGQRL